MTKSVGDAEARFSQLALHTVGCTARGAARVVPDPQTVSGDSRGVEEMVQPGASFRG